jgi:hypothetical protein
MPVRAGLWLATGMQAANDVLAKKNFECDQVFLPLQNTGRFSPVIPPIRLKRAATVPRLNHVYLPLFTALKMFQRY